MIGATYRPIAGFRGRTAAVLLQIWYAVRRAFSVPGHVLAATFVRVGSWQRRTRPADRAAALATTGTVAPAAPPAERSGATGRPGLPRAEWVAVGPDFGEAQYAAVFAQLQHTPGSKLLDLRAATAIELDAFEQLASAWRAPAGTVPRLGILLGYESWVAFRHVVARQLGPLAEAGVELEMFYAQQYPSLAAWFSEGRVYHDHLPDVIEWLRAQWRPTTAWPLVLTTTEMLIHATAAIDAAPDMLLQLSAIALSFEGPAAAAMGTKHARAALSWVGQTPSAARCRALRALAIALTHGGESGEALGLLETARTQASLLRDRVEQARALAEIGFQALRWGDFAHAETRFRRAIVLVSATDAPYLRAALHHSLADALHQQGKNRHEAERHAALALALRWNQESRLGDDDRTLLARIRAELPSSLSE